MKQVIEQGNRFYEAYIKLLQVTNTPTGTTDPRGFEKDTGQVFIDDPMMEQRIAKKLETMINSLLQRKQNG